MRQMLLLNRIVLIASLSLGLALAASADVPLAISGEPAPLMDKNAADLDLRLANYPDKAISQVALPPIAQRHIDALRKHNSESGAKALQIGIERELAEADVNPLPALTWFASKDGRVARFSVSSPAARALRIGFRTLDLPKTAQLRFVGDGQLRSVVDVVTAAEIAQQYHGIYWSPVTEGERQSVEIFLPTGSSESTVRVEISRVSHMLASPYGELSGLKIGESDACEIDANCISNPSTAYINAKNAVARMSFQVNGGSFVCTGTLLNDTVSSSFIPYFYTANHCLSTQAAASTLTTFWFEESTSCGSGVASARTQVSGGATLLFNNQATDVLFLRLNNAAPNGAFFTGWDSAAVTIPSNILVIHHPAGDVKKVSLGQTTSFGTYNGAGDFIRAGYTNGTTEGGSSGSGLLTLVNNQYTLRGGLYGGSASCANTGNINTPANTDAYSRFDQAFPSLQQFLAPTQQSAQLQNGVAVNGLAGATGSSLAYTISIPAGASNLVVRTSGGSGDPDLYVRFGTAPTLSTFDCRSFAIGPVEQCSFPTPSAGTYHVLISGFEAYSGLSLTASWTTGSTGSIDEPSFTGFALPLPNPAFPSCPGGYFVAAIDDGPAAGLSPGIFGLDLFLNAPGTLRLEGGLNFGGSLDGSQVAFAGFNIQNTANEPQRLTLILNGNPRTSQAATLPVLITLIRQPSAGVNETVYQSNATLSLGQAFTHTMTIQPGFHVVTVAPTGSASVPGGAADGQVYVSLASQFVDRPGGGFFGGVVVGGYHAAPPFGDNSGFASFCLGTGHSATARVLSAPTYGVTGARDLRLRLLDHLSRTVISVPASAANTPDQAPPR